MQAVRLLTFAKNPAPTPNQENENAWIIAGFRGILTGFSRKIVGMSCPPPFAQNCEAIFSFTLCHVEGPVPDP